MIPLFSEHKIWIVCILYTYNSITNDSKLLRPPTPLQDRRPFNFQRWYEWTHKPFQSSFVLHVDVRVTRQFKLSYLRMYRILLPWNIRTEFDLHSQNVLPYLGMYRILSATTKPTVNNKLEAGRKGIATKRPPITRGADLWCWNKRKNRT